MIEDMRSSFGYEQGQAPPCSGLLPFSIRICLIAMRHPLYLFQPVQLKRTNHSLEIIPFDAQEDTALERIMSHPGRYLGYELATEYDQPVKQDSWLLSTPQHVPLNRLRDIHAFVDVRFNSAIILLLAKHLIPVHFYNYYGYYKGSFMPQKVQVDGRLLLEQAAVWNDPYRRLYYAKKLLQASLHNIRRMIRYYTYRDGLPNSLLYDLDDASDYIQQCDTINELMGTEGMIRQHFYQVVDQSLRHGFELKGRVYHPPSNPANALISFLNALLYSTIQNELWHTRLEPSIGVLHSPGRKRYPLVWDVAEIYKPLFVEGVLLSLVRRKVLKLEHFETETSYPLLNEEGRYRVVRAFEEKMRETIKIRELGRSVSYRSLIRQECHKFARSVQHGETFEPFKLSW